MAEKCQSLPGRGALSTGIGRSGGFSSPSSRSLSMERLKDTGASAVDKGDSAAPSKLPSIEREVKVVVLGPPGVGKSALVVRYLTKRYIGDYADCESICTGSTVWGYKRFKVHLLDTKGDDCSEVEMDAKFSWADAALLVFSIASEESYHQSKRLVDGIITKRIHESCAFVLVGNKSDLGHLRTVTSADAERLASILGCPYVETSARESYTSTVNAFSTLFLELKYLQKRKAKLKKEVPERRNASSTVLHQLRDSLRNLASEFRQRTNTY